jgi:oxygen-independent coproporphyrinogen-3 oxidase
MDPLAVYVHFPFCARKCAYCDFNSRPPSPGEMERYLRALLAQIASSPSAPAATVYFGGGTPTLYPPSELARALQATAQRFPPVPGAEVSVEANPGTVTAQSLRELRVAGFTRLSLGVQSFDDAELALLGRIHSAADARRAVEDARAAGFEDLSVDLIRGLPGQTLSAWEANLRQAVALSPDHIAAYGLSLEPGTPLAAQVAQGALAQPASGDPEWVRVTVDLLSGAGYERYEVSNFARPGHACRHNLAYWHNRPYLGLGAGAWSYEIGARGAVRYRNEPDIAGFCDAALRGENLVSERDPQDLQVAAAEALMVGLRLAEGVSIEEIHQRFGIELRARHGALVRHLVAAGLMLDDGVALRLTFEGMLVQSAVAARFLPDG